MKKGLIFLLVMFTCVMLVGCGKKKEEPNNPGGGGEVNPKPEIIGKELKNASENISLTKKEETAKYNNLELNFYGEDVSSTTNVKDSYKYVVKLKLGETEINSNVFSNEMVRYINSDNLSSTFTIYMIDDLYILKSSTGAQKDGEYGLVFDNSGNFIRSFEDVTLNINIDNHTVEMTKCFNTEDDCVKASYKISSNKFSIAK